MPNKISTIAAEKLYAKHPWSQSNTTVAQIKQYEWGLILHGKQVAKLTESPKWKIEISDCGYATRTTQQRVDAVAQGYNKNIQATIAGGELSIRWVGECAELLTKKELLYKPLTDWIDMEKAANHFHDLINQKKSHIKLAELFKELGIEFGIDFHKYREDSDYMCIRYQGKLIFSGTTEDITTKSRSEVYNSPQESK